MHLHAVDADCLAVQVDEGPPRVAEGDGGVRLDVLRDVTALGEQNLAGQ